MTIQGGDGAEIYALRNNDNLYSIAVIFGTTVANLMSINNLTTNNLIIDQKLIIP